jgi:photosystem II stability/assembly factor-like uncharacterized protein
MKLKRTMLVFLSIALLSSLAHAQFDESILKNLTWRNIGPAGAGGRVVDFAVAGEFPYRMYAATASGGLFKSSNNGVTWDPVFDNESTVSIGDVTVDPNNPDTVWVGSGEANPRNSVSWGDGVYKSTNGGRSWTNMGLKDSKHIGRIAIDPRNPDTVYVAALGHTWGPNKERGLFKTTDGGKTWTNTLFIDENTGFIDLAMDPRDPNTLYAASWQFRRDGFAGGDPAICCGSGSGIYKTSDGGRNWRKLTSGLPGGELGRIGLAVADSNPSVIYAVIQTTTTVAREGAGGPEGGGGGGGGGAAQANKTMRDGGIFRSEDRGETWRWMNPLNNRPFYYSQLRVDPTNENRLWAVAGSLSLSEDGGKTFTNPAVNIHVDHHAMWINPKNPRHILDGNDGGIYMTYDGGKTWDFMNQIAISQFYAVDVDMRKPYFIYGGVQDYCSWGGPSATRNTIGITNSDWFKVQTGDGFQARVDPTDHNIVYAESQNGGLIRHDLKTGRNVNIKPRPRAGEEAYRFDWETPIIISPHDPKTIFVGANFLFRSPDRGNSWVTISPDLTAGVGTSRLTAITTISESPMRPGMLYVGTNDGNVQVTRDGGKTWKNVTANFPGMPGKRWVSRVVASRFNEGTAFVSFDGHRNDDYATYLFKTTDYGDTWTAIKGNLPADQPVRVVREDVKNRNLLFAGTEFAAFASIDNGAHWVRLASGMPTVAVADLVVHPREGDLIAGTHGRSIYVTEITPLQQLNDTVLSSEVHLFTPRPAVAFMYKVFSDDQFLAEKRFVADNPEYGAGIFYYLKGAASGDVKLTILDKSGAVVRELTGSKDRGINRIQWDLRYAAPPRVEGGGGGGGGFGGNTLGPMADPGTYTARLTVAGKQVTANVVVEADPQLEITEQDRRTLRTITDNIIRAQTRTTAAVRSADSLNEQMAAVAKSVASAKTITPALKKNVDDSARQVTDLRDKLRRLNTRMTSLYGEVTSSPFPPTAQQTRDLDDISKELDGHVTSLNAMINTSIPTLETQLNKENVPRINAPQPVRP